MPVLLVVGGSTGAQRVNEAVRKVMPKLIESFQVIHICGKGKTDPEFDHIRGLRQYEYVSDDLKDMFAAADIAAVIRCSMPKPLRKTAIAIS